MPSERRYPDLIPPQPLTQPHPPTQQPYQELDAEITALLHQILELKKVRNEQVKKNETTVLNSVNGQNDRRYPDLTPQQPTQQSYQELDAEIAALHCRISELQKARDEQFEKDEAIALDLKRLQDKHEIDKIFQSINAKLSPCHASGHRFSKSFENDLSNLRSSIYSFKIELTREMQTRTDDFTLKTAHKLDEAIDKMLDAERTASEKDKAVNSFRDTARNARFSHNTKVAAAAVVGGMIGLALWVGLTIASGGTAGLITFAGLGLAALIVTFGATHFAARGDSALRSANPHETRGKQVSDNLKTLLRYRQELAFMSSNKSQKSPSQNQPAPAPAATFAYC